MAPESSELGRNLSNSGMHGTTRERLTGDLVREEAAREWMMVDGLARLFTNAGVPRRLVRRKAGA